MREWLVEKLGAITEEFLGGATYGDVFEASYLCYLEALQVASGRKPAVWEDWRARIARRVGTEPVVPMNRLLDDRQALVNELEAFRRSLEGPRRRVFVPPSAQAPEMASTVGKEIDLFDLLSGGGS